MPLYHILTKQIDPSSFERLIQRLLRESGFVQVEVTGRTGDGGIDGKGIARIHGFMSFHVVFQCKRYSGIVSASHIRDFRGAMVGRADKGLLLRPAHFHATPSRKPPETVPLQLTSLTATNSPTSSKNLASACKPK